jgi:hypothetical protein
MRQGALQQRSVAKAVAERAQQMVAGLVQPPACARSGD